MVMDPSATLGSILSLNRKRKQRDDGPDSCVDPIRTPWGLQCRGHRHDLWNQYRSCTRIRGHWLNDGWTNVYGVRKITIPKFSTLAAFRRPHEVEPETDMLERVEILPTLKPTKVTGRCLILELPYEILSQILRQLIPSGSVYRFLPAKDVSIPVQVVQRLTPTAAPILPSVHIALGATCSQLNRSVNEILYGENDFVFNVAAPPIYSSIYTSDSSLFESWVKVLRREPRALGGLTERAASYLRRAMFIITLPPAYTTIDIRKFQDVFEQMATALKSNPGFDQLIIDFQLGAPTLGENGRWRDYQSLQAVVDKKTHKLSLAMKDSKLKLVGRFRRAQSVLDPLEKLPKAKKVVLSGEMNSAMAEKLRGLLGSTED